jgi:hypothetical protein
MDDDSDSLKGQTGKASAMTPTPQSPVRRTPVVRKLVEAVNRKSETYEAFKASTELPRMLWIRTNNANRYVDCAVSYRYVYSMGFARNGSGISVILTGSAKIFAYGRNLRPLFERLLTHEINWIQEYDPERWNKPGPGEACITRIEIRNPNAKPPEMPGTLQ